MIGVTILPRRMEPGARALDPESEDEGTQVFYDPSDPHSVRRARALLAAHLGIDQGPELFGGATREPFWRQWGRLVRSVRAA